MTTFVKAFPETLVSLNAIKEVRSGPDDDYVTLCLHGGGERWSRKEDWQSVMNHSSVTMVPAAPGTFKVFHCVSGKGMIDVSRRPILAWMFNEQGHLTHILMSKGPEEVLEDTAIEYPDGTVEAFECTYCSCDALLEEVRIRERQADSADEGHPVAEVYAHRPPF